MRVLDVRAPLSRISPARAAAAAGLLCLMAALAVMLTLTLRDPLKDDIAWLLYVAGQWLHGQRLYVDLVEVNPPLIIWLYAIPVWVAGLFGLAPQWVAMPGFGALILSCAWWTAGLLSSPERASPDRLIVFSAIGCVLLLLPGAEFGQREHLLTATALPYLALVGGELAAKRVGRWRAVFIGVVAALGCALKPTYVVAFAMVELFACWQGLRLFRPASLAAAATLCLYVLTVLLFAPAFFTEAVPMALALYSATDSALRDLLFDSRLIVFAIVVGFLLLAAQRRARDPVLQLAVLFIFAAGATLVCVMQGKNWFYHRLPGYISAVLGLLGWLYWFGLRTHPRDWRRLGLVGLTVLTLLEFGTGMYQRLRPQLQIALDERQSTEDRLDRLIRREHAHSYLAFSEWIGLGFPVVNNTGVRWASRFDSMWPLHAAINSPPPDWPVAAWVAEDFLRTCPDLVVVDRGAPANYVALLSKAEPAFRKAWALYKPIGSFDRLLVYRNRASTAAKRAVDCGGTAVAKQDK
jgi:hypothetical protein